MAWKITVDGPMNVHQKSPQNASYGRVRDFASCYGRPLPKPPPVFDSVPVECRYCGSTSGFLVTGDWDGIGKLCCLRCDREFGLGDPLLAAGLLKECILASISQSGRDANAIWEMPAPSLTAAIRPKAAAARTAFASGLWVLSSETVSFLESLLIRLRRPQRMAGYSLGERIDQVQRAVVALHEQRGSEWTVQQWLSECGQALAPAAAFSDSEFRTSLPVGLIDAEEALGRVREELRRAIDQTGTA
ncbi:hypothetical protein HUT16_17080 [Kitasatospora sp. NA04385]|uniref:hypothetical protein n=1 Tax=Kitasatospora sp. NA04385 TaxID=2742135 RepID=UPI001590D05D|nr:hypothetical protein [Kitasatospora sp. NA04385]QKW20551.1 hypothetical protein HUT16_17080 [Kitasatospora sp. NA04385]